MTGEALSPTWYSVHAHSGVPEHFCNIILQRGQWWQRADEVRRHYNGEIMVPLPELDDIEKPATANLLAMGVEQFAERARASGVDGVLVVDYPPEEAQELLRALEPRGIDMIFLMAPTTTDTRMREIANNARLPVVTLDGVVGVTAWRA